MNGNGTVGSIQVCVAELRSAGSHVCTKVTSFDSAMRCCEPVWLRTITEKAIASDATRMPETIIEMSSSGSVKPPSRLRDVG